jgi:hypothetical protein
MVWAKGNHEHFAVNFFNKGAGGLEESFIKKFFNTAITESISLKEKIVEVYKRSYDWIETPECIVTHSPCEKRFLKKESKEALRAQRNLRPRYVEDNPEKLLSFLKTEDDFCHKKHVFGHVPFEHPLGGKSYVGIDTGAVYGNYLTVANYKGFFDFHKIPSIKYANGSLNY